MSSPVYTAIQEKKPMAFGRSERRRRSAAVEPVTLKILVAGGFGVGKTTLVGAVSEIKPLRTEERLTEAGRPVDDLDGVEAKTTTTVAMDFGRITVNEQLVLYLFGTPGQDRFWFLWDELARGALGAVVLADTRRLADSFSAIDYFERRGLPFTVAVNCFDGADRYPPQAVRDALDLDPEVPVVLCDARLKDSARDVLISVVEHARETGARRREPALP
ncbi:ATP-binding protein [Streptomyces tubercidicus]|uniref:ATP-binding protein n=2 Tax=Streptomyces tubercidicus TaxID=47759 RepID=A0A640V3F4_9ACTN|nr:ATP-binding protein [Streptomyces tubercidicus]